MCVGGGGEGAAAKEKGRGWGGGEKEEGKVFKKKTRLLGHAMNYTKLQ